ncbi:hypothetical protein ANCDUO_04865 [Ancylostoma duodenale]|uniref:Uncharacterized protein n=1 Tax=Ancylostoma duodenale TaxID=51022 RepID=A0A0C2DQ67_9BILA|nr:hypothetical protein ANCDUO_04865 [Ancylostoma duodenale]
MLKVLLEVSAAEDAYKRPGNNEESNPDRTILERNAGLILPSLAVRLLRFASGGKRVGRP